MREPERVDALRLRPKQRSVARHWRSAIVLLVTVVVATSCGRIAPSNAERSKPNIIVINVDDADLDLIGAEAVVSYFPNIDRHLQQAGTRFDNMHVADPLCGPSRASLFRGQYPHNTGIELNYQNTQDSGPTGSWAEFLDRGYADEELGVWMQRGGYFTALVGKYHHTEYPTAAGNGSFTPPGWSDFRTSLGGRYFDVRRVVNNERQQTAPGEYRTDVERNDVLQIIQERDPSTPLFLMVAPLGPHRATVGEPFAERHADLFAGVEVDRSAPDFNEADVSDKPPEIAVLPVLDDASIQALDEEFRDRLRSMMAIDEMVGDIFEELERNEMLDDTYVLFTSDNGYLLGHHRLAAKGVAYDRSTRVGLIVAGPGVEGGTTSNELLSHVDITRTVLDLAAAEAPAFLDGVSFVPLLEDAGASLRREAILIEHQEPKRYRGSTIEMRYDALRLIDSVYIEWESGSREFYDLATDPYQLENQYEQLDPARQQSLAEQLDELRDCSGAGCTEADLDTPDDGPSIEVEEVSSVDGVLTVRGVANDVETQRVELVIRSVSDNRYWDGDELVDDERRVEVDAVQANRTWIYSASIDTGRYWVGAWAVDRAGNRTSRIDGTFVETAGWLARVPMATFVTAAGDVVQGGVALRGTVRRPDEAPSAQAVFVRLSRLREDFRQYWNGSVWVDDPVTWIEAGLDDDGSWTFDELLPPGEYRAEAYASDLSGSFQSWDHGRPLIDFHVE